jgi:superfamily I DNA/RNA helicase
MQLFRSVATGSELAPEKEEERRVMFVALTRARRYCLVALPNDSNGLEIADHCVDLGFVRIKQTYGAERRQASAGSRRWVSTAGHLSLKQEDYYSL